MTSVHEDGEIVRRVLEGEVELFEILMRRYNARLYRVAAAILRNEAEAEDVVQDAYVRAYENLGQYAGRSSVATWLVKIAVHEGLARRRRLQRLAPLPESGAESSGEADPERLAARNEMRAALLSALRDLPEAYRLVFTLRAVENLSTAETAECLNIPEATVKTRLHRARAVLRKRFGEDLHGLTQGALPFGGERCDRIVASVLRRVLQYDAAL